MQSEMQRGRSPLGQICRSLPQNAWDVLLEAYYLRCRVAAERRVRGSGAGGEACGAVSPNVKGRPTWAVAVAGLVRPRDSRVEARFELSHRNGASLPQTTVPYQNQEGLTAEG
jgi:hypothetical protein